MMYKQIRATDNGWLLINDSVVISSRLLWGPLHTGRRNNPIYNHLLPTIIVSTTA